MYFLLSVIRDPIIEFDLHLHGNKRNERNEMYRRRLTDEVYLKHNFHYYIVIKRNIAI